MVRNAMAKRFPLESPEALESIAPYLYQITAARGSGEYALNLLLEPGAWARRPLCERLLPLQGGKLSSPINQRICVSCSRSVALPLLVPTSSTPSRCNSPVAVPAAFVYGSRDWMDPQHAHDLVPKLAAPASVSSAAAGG